MKKFTRESIVPSILVYGRSGTGKTYSLATIPDKYLPAYIINVENKLASLYPPKDEDYFYVSEPIVNMDSFKAALRELEANRDNVKTIIVDSLTYLQNMYALSISSLKDNDRTKFKYFDMVGDFVNKVLDKIFSFTDKVKIFTCLEDVEGLTNKYSGMIMLQGKSKITVISRFDSVLYSFVDNGRYLWRTKPYGDIVCKTHLVNIDEIIPQDYSLILGG
jgi:hypothetical protein